jgi:HEAT repeat protein
LATFKPPSPEAIAGLIAAAKAEEHLPQQTASPNPGPVTDSQSVQASIDRAQRRHARASSVTALGVLAPGDPEVQKIILELTDDMLIEVRVAVALALPLNSCNRQSAFAAEVKLASDSDQFVQSQAITALGGFPERFVDSCPVLYRASLSKQKPLVDGAYEALSKLIKGPTFDLATASGSSEAPLRFAAAFSRNPNSDDGFKALESALKDRDSGVRWMAANRLGTVSSKRSTTALHALEAASAEKDPDARVAILRSINLLKPRPPESTH